MAEKERIITPIGRVSFPYLDTPKVWDKNDPNEKPKYSVNLIFSKAEMTPADREALKKLKSACMKAGLDMFPPQKDRNGNEIEGSGYSKKHYSWPFRSGTEPSVVGKEGYGEGTEFVSLRSEFPVQLLNARKEPISASDIYAGCYARACVTISAYKHIKGGKGVTMFLAAVQKIRNGDPLSSGIDASNDFDEVDEEFLDGEDEEDGFDEEEEETPPKRKKQGK